MEPEYGRVYSVETRWAGANVDGDHPAGSTTLNVLLGWDFDEDGGECEVDEATFTYSSAVFPDPADEDDDEPIVLHLAAPLPDAVDDGAFVKVLPGGADKVATVEVTGQGEPVSAVVDHALFDRLADGIRGDAYEAETVQLVQDDFGSWRVINVVGQEPVVDLSYADTTVDLPPAIIPEEGVTQFSQAVIDEAVIDHLEGDVAVLGTVYAAMRGEDGEVDPDGNIVKLSALPDSNLIEALVPTGELDDDGNILYRPLLTVPSRAQDPNGDPVALDVYGATIRGGSVSADRLSAAGDKTAGDVSSVEAGSRLVVRNVVSDPNTAPSIDFGPKTRRWSRVAERYEIGWGVSNGLVVQSRVTVGNDAGINYATAVFINPATGTLDHAVNLKLGSSNSLFPFQKFAGFTATNNWLYVLFTFDTNVWQIARFDAQTGNWDRTMRSPAQQSGNRMALGLNGGPAVMTLDNDNQLFVADFGTGLSPSSVVWHPTDLTTTARPVGCVADGGRTYVAIGSRVRCFGPAYNEQSQRSWSTSGELTGFGRLPDGTFATTSGDGNLTVYNSDVEADGGKLYAAWTKRHTPTGRETLMSPVATRNWPARMFATINVDGRAPGTNDSTIYAGDSSSSRSSLHRLSKPVGNTQYTISSAPSSGSNPPVSSGFTASGDPGDVVSEAESNGSPLATFPGDGQLRAPIGVAGQSGVTVCPVSATDTTYTRNVTFSETFPEPPIVVLTAQDIGSPQTVFLSAGSPSYPVTSAGFTILYRRTSGTGDISVGWHAMPRTQ